MRAAIVSVGRRIRDWWEKRDWDEGATLMVFGSLIGLASGLAVVGFYKLIDVAHLLLIQIPESHQPSVGQVLYRPLLTGAGLWAAWFVVRRAKLPDGQNVPDVQLAVAKRDGVIRFWPVSVRTVASALTLGSGASAGSEGPVAVLGAGLGSTLGRRLRFQARHVKILVGCGAAAGIAGAFNAPFAGAFFALEEVLGSFSVGAFSPVVIASVVGALTVRPFLGNQPIFASRVPASARPAEILLYPALGVACGLVSAFYSRLYLAATARGRRMPGPAWVWPLAAGAVTGLIVIASRGLLAGNGHLAIPDSVFGGLAWYALLGDRAGENSRDGDHAGLRRIGRRVHADAVHRRGARRRPGRAGRQGHPRWTHPSARVGLRRHGRPRRRRDARAAHGDIHRVRDD